MAVWAVSASRWRTRSAPRRQATRAAALTCRLYHPKSTVPSQSLQHSLPLLARLAITDEASPFALPSTRNSSEDSSAPRRGVEGGAGQLFSGGGQGRGVGVVTRSRYGWPSATRRCDPGEVWPPSGWSPVARMSGRRPRRWSPCPRALSAVRTSESNRSSGRPVSTRPVSTRPVPCRCVRTDGSPVSAALQPRCPNRAGPWNGSVGGPPPLG